MSFLESFHPELKIDNFSRLDGTIIFFAFAKAAMKRVGARTVMDFGAGRGLAFDPDAGEPSLFKRGLMDLRSDGAEVWACDIDEVVLGHPASDHQVVIDPDGTIPLADAMFDVIVSDVTFEHVVDPQIVARELLRVLKPGGYICARTPNKYGYVTFAARIVPNRHHVRVLKKVAPVKQALDVFPTVFRMNTVRDIKRLFPGCEIAWYRDSAGPSYYFDNKLIYRLFLGLHKILPNVLATSLCVFIRKPGPGSGASLASGG